jgi:hypothetical protein
MSDPKRTLLAVSSTPFSDAAPVASLILNFVVNAHDGTLAVDIDARGKPTRDHVEAAIEVLQYKLAEVDAIEAAAKARR